MAVEGGGTLSEIYQSAKKLLLRARDGVEKLERRESSTSSGGYDSPELSFAVKKDISQIRSLCVEMDRLWRSVAAKSQRDLWKRKVEQVPEEADSLKESLDKYLLRNQRRMNEARERAELLGRANGESAHVLRIFDEEAQATQSVRNSSRMLEESFATGTAILGKYAEQRERLKILDRFDRIFNSDSIPAAAAAARIMEKLQVAGQKGVVIKKKSMVGCVRYAECERNHGVKDGGSAVDGCKEFIAENEGSALTCSCCGCHRNYHRIVKETDQVQESFGVGEQKKRKRRELKSKVWDDFTRSIDKDGKEWAICKHCKEQFDGSSKNGTTHLKNHLESMKCRAKKNGGDGNEDVSTQIRDLATLTPVVMKEKPFVIDLIEQSFFEGEYLTDDWDPSVLNSSKDEILQVYQEEKEKQGEFLNNLSCRFSLHICRADDNVMLMVHYIDDSWERQNKIISIIPRENYIQETIKSCLDLKIDKNIWSIQHDRLMIDDDEEIIESWFSQRGSLPFVGVGFDFHHFMERVELFTVEWKMNEIDGLRECVAYGYKTPLNNLKLQLAVKNVKTMGKKVFFNDHPSLRYVDSPFQVGSKEAFSELEKIDSDFISINLTNRKWDETTATFEHFKALEEFVNSFFWDNCSSITTIVVDILKLFRFHSSEDCQVCKNASYKNLFDKI